MPSLEALRCPLCSEKQGPLFRELSNETTPSPGSLDSALRVCSKHAIYPPPTNRNCTHFALTSKTRITRLSPTGPRSCRSFEAVGWRHALAQVHPPTPRSPAQASSHDILRPPRTRFCDLVLKRKTYTLAEQANESYKLSLMEGRHESQQIKAEEGEAIVCYFSYRARTT